MTREEEDRLTPPTPTQATRPARGVRILRTRRMTIPSVQATTNVLPKERCGICPGLLRARTAPLLADGLRRTQPGFCGHLRLTTQTSLMSFWRTMDIRPQQLSGLVLLVQVYRYTGIPLNRGRSRKLGTSRGQCCQACEAKGIKMLFLVVMIFAAGFLGVMDVLVFKTPGWSPTGFLNVQIALALLVSVYSLQLFSCKLSFNRAGGLSD
eukprot:s3370_g3.t1